VKDWLTMGVVNGGTIGVVSLTELELGLKVTLLLLTCAWTVVKIVKLLKEKE